MNENEKILKFANSLADEASRITMSYFLQDLEIVNKSDKGFDPVTIADKKTEEVIRSLITKEFPDHGIIGEEYDNHGSFNGPYWVIDPIDGTRAFLLQIPVWGTLIAFNNGPEPIFGIVDQPYQKKRYIGFNNECFLLNEGQKISLNTKNTKNLENSVISCTDPFLFSEKELDSFRKLSSVSRIRRFGLDCTGFCLLASGQIDLVIEADLKIYDIQALIPIIRGAGGIVTTWEGEDPSTGGNILASCNKKLHADAMAILA